MFLEGEKNVANMLILTKRMYKSKAITISPSEVF